MTKLNDAESKVRPLKSEIDRLTSDIGEAEEIITDLSTKILELNPNISAIQDKISDFERKFRTKTVDNQELCNLVRGVGKVENFQVSVKRQI